MFVFYYSCYFTHAMCEYLHSPTPIQLQNHGQCVSTTAAMTTVTDAAASTTAASGSGATTTPGSVAVSTTADAHTHPSPGHTTATTSATVTTTDPLASVLQGVFCTNVATISCATSFEVICATNGKYYPNR